MDFQEYLKESAYETEKVIDQILKKWRREVSSLSPKLLPLVDLFLEACQGGKRLRAMLVRLGYEVMGGEPNLEIYQAAAGVELFQTGILAQDDIIDLSPLRRGRPTIYQALGADHYAFSQTMILGDIGMFLAAEQILESDFPDIRKNQALSLFTQMLINTGLGEMLDVQLPHLRQKSAQDIKTIFKLKTAYYTFIDPLSIGAVLAGARSALLARFKEFGISLGLAYQIQDDILGVFGDEKTLGKSVTSDIEEGKNTLLITYALQHAEKKQKQILNNHYGKGPISQKVHQKIKKVFMGTGALGYSQKQVQTYVNQARELIPIITFDPQKQQLLQGLADFLINRQR